MRRFVTWMVLLAVCLGQNQAVFAETPHRITPTESAAITPKGNLTVMARCDTAVLPSLRPPVAVARPAYLTDESGEASHLEVEFDLSREQSDLYRQILQLTSDPEHVGTCENVALEVAGHALFYWDIQKHLRSALKNTANAVRDGAKLGGADTLAKVAEVAGELISAYDTDQPEAAIGRSIINNSVDWAVDKAKGAAKTGNDQVDEQLKDGAKSVGERARDRLTNGLFGGPLAPRITESTTIPELRYCEPTITFEFREPRGGDKGGLFLQVTGTCDCTNPNNQIKLRYFYVTIFLPLTGMEARVEWTRHFMKTALDIKDLMEKSHALKKGVDDSMKPASERDEGEEEPDLQQLSHDVAEAAGTASDVTPTLVLIPRFAQPTWDTLQIHAECGCDSSSQTGVQPPPEEPPRTTPPTPEEPPPPSETPGAREVNHLCRKQCESLFNTWKMEEADRVQICSDYFTAAMAGRKDPVQAQRCKNMFERTDAARRAYYRCLEACYQKGVGAGLIPEVPHEITERAHPPERPQPPPPSSAPRTTTGTGATTTPQTPVQPRTAMTPRGQPANVLPDGAVYAEATIEPNSTIEVQQPGTALVERNGVTVAQRVRPGDKLDPRTTRSIYLDNGSGLIVHVGRTVDKLTAMVGNHAFTDGSREGLPTFNNTVTTCVQSDRPFETSSVTTGGTNHAPAQTNVVIRNAQGQKVGEFATYVDVKGENVSIRTLDQAGRTTGEAHLQGGAQSATPAVAFDSPTYKEGQGGTLNIGNQQYYQAFVTMTRFGGADVTKMPIRFLVISDVRGIPPQVPFGTTSVRFTAGKAGQARVQVLMPGLSPPRPADPENSNPDRRQASPIFTQWLQQFQPQ